MESLSDFFLLRIVVRDRERGCAVQLFVDHRPHRVLGAAERLSGTLVVSRLPVRPDLRGGQHGARPRRFLYFL